MQSMSKPLRILIIEDSEDDALLLLRELRKGGYEPVFTRVETLEAMREALSREAWDLVISDYVLPQFSGLDALKTLQENGSDLPFIVVSGNIGEDVAVEAMKAGAHDYLIKGNLARLVPAVERELRDVEVRRARKQAEAERALLAAAIEASADAVVVTNAQGFIEYVNAGFERMTGYSKLEALGRSLHFLDSGKHDEDFYQALRDTLTRDGVWSGRLFNRKKDGTLYFEDCTSSPIKDQQGSILYYVSVKRDVTEKVRLESIAESISFTDNIGYIFAGVRHEIGDPISTLLLILEHLDSKLGSDPPEAVKKYVSQALNQVTRVEHLLSSLKNFNMFESLDFREVQLTSFIEMFLSLVSEDYTKRGITIDVLIAPDADLVYADKRALQQVLLNLFNNAAAALDGALNPKISLRVTPAKNFSNMVLLRVQDNGCGMTEEEQKNLFRPFYTTKQRGTGLGMVIVKKMLAKMHGAIEIQSRKHEGTIVDLFIPREKP